MNPITGRPADHSDPRTWATFDAAVRRWQKDGLAGIGFVFAGEGFAGVDLDGCRGTDGGGLAPWAEAIVREFKTYTEVSPSGTGVKLIARGRLDPDGRRRNGAVEVYDRSRFFALTGRRLPETPRRIADCQEPLSALQRQLARPNLGPEPITADGGFDGPDAGLLAVAFSARNGHRVRSLWGGDLLSHPSFSEALLGLARCLAFYTGPDEDRLERLMLGSPLVAASEADRTKWHTPRRGGTWGRVYIVRKAIQSCPIFYSGSRGVGHSTYTVGGATLPYPPNPEPARDSGSESAVTRAWARVKAGEFPSAAVRLADEKARKLAALCWHLSQKGDRQFYLGARTAGKLLNTSKNTAWRRLKALAAAGMIRAVRVGRYHPHAEAGCATEYEWVGEVPAARNLRPSGQVQKR